MPDPGNPQSFDRYSYVYNNPLKYTDPSGHIACLDEECRLAIHPVAGEVQRGSVPPIEEFQDLIDLVSGPGEPEWDSASKYAVLQGTRGTETALVQLTRSSNCQAATVLPQPWPLTISSG